MPGIRWSIAIRAAVGLLLTLSAFGQGTILFNTRVPGQVDAPVAIEENGVRRGPDTAWTAQLFQARGSESAPFYLALSPSTMFRTSSPADSFYVEPVTVVTGSLPGEAIRLVMRVWVGAPGWDGRVWGGQSNGIDVQVGGG